MSQGPKGSSDKRLLQDVAFGGRRHSKLGIRARSSSPRASSRRNVGDHVGRLEVEIKAAGIERDLQEALEEIERLKAYIAELERQLVSEGRPEGRLPLSRAQCP